jgi:hypothetical protein
MHKLVEISTPNGGSPSAGAAGLPIARRLDSATSAQ